MSKEMYYTYYQDYQRLVSEYAISPTTDLYKELQQILQQMNTEARCMTTLDKEEFIQRTQQYKQNVAHMASKQDHCSDLFSSSRNNNNNHHSDDLSSTQVSWQVNEDRISQQNETLERARRTIMETEEISQAIHEELERNRTTMQSSHQKTKDLSDMTQQAGAIIKNMTPWWRR